VSYRPNHRKAKEFGKCARCWIEPCMKLYNTAVLQPATCISCQRLCRSCNTCYSQRSFLQFDDVTKYDSIPVSRYFCLWR